MILIHIDLEEKSWFFEGDTLNAILSLLILDCCFTFTHTYNSKNYKNSIINNDYTWQSIMRHAAARSTFENLSKYLKKRVKW